MTPEDYVKSGKHLPAPLRDFHDTKDLFKLLHRLYGSESEGKFKYYDESASWVFGQCYVIDWFLWFMGQRGYTLQKSRADVDFKDLGAEISQMKEEDVELFRKAMKERLNPAGREQ